MRRYFPRTVCYGKLTGLEPAPWRGSPPSCSMVHLTSSCPEGAALRARLLELWERTGSASLGCLAQNGSPRAGYVVASEQEYTDWVSTCLMDTFKDTGDPAVFAL